MPACARSALRCFDGLLCKKEWNPQRAISHSFESTTKTLMRILRRRTRRFGSDRRNASAWFRELDDRCGTVLRFLGWGTRGPSPSHSKEAKMTEHPGRDAVGNCAQRTMTDYWVSKLFFDLQH